jgi:hypothetical protein
MEYASRGPAPRRPPPAERGARLPDATTVAHSPQSPLQRPCAATPLTSVEAGRWSVQSAECSASGLQTGGRRRTRLSRVRDTEVSGRVWAFQLHAVRLVFRCRLFAFRGLFTPRTARVRVNRESSVIVSEAQPLTLHVTNYKAVDKGPKRKTRNIGLNIY